MPPQILKSVLFFSGLLLAAMLLIHFGLRSDADTVARATKTAVLTSDTVNLAFERVSGRLVSRSAEEASRVKAGDPLLTLDGTDTEIALSAAKAREAALEAAVREAEAAMKVAADSADRAELASWRNIETLEAGRRTARSAFEKAEADFKRSEALLASGGVSRAQYDAAKEGRDAARGELTRAERALASETIGAAPSELKKLRLTGSAEGMTLASVRIDRASVKNRENTIANLRAQTEAAKSDVRQLEADRSRLTLRAPDDGKILEVYVQPGDMVNAGALTMLLETNRRYADFYLDEERASKVKEGDTVKLFCPALGKEVGGRVRIAAPATSFSDLRAIRERGQAGLTSFRIRVSVPETPGLLTGMTLEWEHGRA